MLSKEQLEKRIAEIRKTPGAVLWPTGDRVELALNEAEALEELLSLREQLAELKALEPFGYIDSVRTDNWNYINLKGETSTVAFISKTADGLMRKDYAMPLFTAAKPAED